MNTTRVTTPVPESDGYPHDLLSPTSTTPSLSGHPASSRDADSKADFAASSPFVEPSNYDRGVSASQEGRESAGKGSPKAEESARLAATGCREQFRSPYQTFRCRSCGQDEPEAKYFANAYGIECEGSLLAAGDLEE